MDVIIVGAGGHGKVVLEILRATGKYKPIGFVDADVSLAGTTVAGLTVIGAPNSLTRIRQQKIRGAIVAVGDNRARVQYAELLRDQGFELVNAIHPTASVSPTAVLGVNIVVAAQAALCVEAKIEDSVIINTGAMVDHECVIGQGAHICPGARLAGRVRVGTCALVGIGASIIQCVTIGDRSIVGAGAAVISDIPDHCTAVGVPARVIKSSVTHSAR